MGGQSFSPRFVPLSGAGLYFSPWVSLGVGLGYSAIPDRFKKGESNAEKIASGKSNMDLPRFHGHI